MRRKIQTEAKKEQNVGLMVKYPAEGIERPQEAGEGTDLVNGMSFLSEGLGKMLREEELLLHRV